MLCNRPWVVSLLRFISVLGGRAEEPSTNTFVYQDVPTGRVQGEIPLLALLSRVPVLLLHAF